MHRESGDRVDGSLAKRWVLDTRRFARSGASESWGNDMGTVFVVVTVAVLALVVHYWRNELKDWQSERRNARRANG